MMTLKCWVIALSVVVASGLHTTTQAMLRPQDDEHETEDHDTRGMNEMETGSAAKMNEATHEQADAQMNAGAGAGAGITPVKRARGASTGDDGAVPSTVTRLAAIIHGGEDSELPDDGRNMNDVGGLHTTDMNKLVDIGAKSKEMNDDQGTDTETGASSIGMLKGMNTVAAASDTKGVHAAMNGAVVTEPQDTPEVPDDESTTVSSRGMNSAINSAAKATMFAEDAINAVDTGAEKDMTLPPDTAMLPHTESDVPPASTRLLKSAPTEATVLAVVGDGASPEPNPEMVRDMDGGDSAIMKSSSDNQNLLMDMAVPQPNFQSHNAGMDENTV